jgi:hypothetical protein
MSVAVRKFNGSGRGRHGQRLFGAHERIAFHGDGNLIRSLRQWLLAAQYLPETTDAHRRVAAGERDHILDSAADVHGCGRNEAHAGRTDVASPLETVHLDLTQLHHLEGEL